MQECFLCKRPMKTEEKMVLEIFEDHQSTKGIEVFIHEKCYDFILSNPKGKVGMCDDCLRVVVHIKKVKNLKLCEYCLGLRDRGEPKGRPPVEPPF